MSFAPVLYVEDEKTDAMLIEFAFKRVGIAHPLQVVTDGNQAIEYLGGAGEYANRARYPFPCLVLLDLNLPIKPGLQVLQWIRSQPQFNTLPVVVYTSSSNVGDFETSRQLGVDDYLVKSGRISVTDQLVKSIKERWLDQCVSSAPG